MPCDGTNQMDAFSLCEHNSRLITSCELCERIPLSLCLSPSLSASMDFSKSLCYRLNAVSIMQFRERFVLVAERVATTGVVVHINRCTDQQLCIMNVITHIKRQHIQTVRVGPWSPMYVAAAGTRTGNQWTNVRSPRYQACSTNTQTHTHIIIFAPKERESPKKRAQKKSNQSLTPV